jgi:hypothetical protein
MLFQVLHVSRSLFRLFLLRSLLATSAVMPPVEVTLAMTKASVVIPTGHIARLRGMGVLAVPTVIIVLDVLDAVIAPLRSGAWVDVDSSFVPFSIRPGGCSS